MKIVTSDFKDNIKLFGRQLDSIITYELDGETIELSNEQLNSVTPHYNASLLKSVMKQLDIDSNIDIPVGTTLNYMLGTKTRDNDEEDYRDNYDYVDYGNYIVYTSEIQEDTHSYKIICYDKMLYAMKDYESMNINYPITIKNYIEAICNKLGLTFKNAEGTFANYDKQIASELYLDTNGNSLGYTYRDVLDELAQVTASTICINENDDELEIRYINNTNDIIDGEYLKNTNVNFGEICGPFNTIVLSRAGGTDKIYLSYPDNLSEEDRIAIEISENQIMNWNDRSDYLSDILNKINGLQYCINDFSSTGICYYDLCDRYNIQIDDNLYSCIMLNDEVNISQGLEENIYTDRIEESVTDYKKADKTDRKINQTTLIVDKQNQIISGVVSQVDEQNEQIAEIKLQYNELLSKISDIADITTSGESSYASVSLEYVNTSQPINIKIHPIIESISYLYPNNSLYPSSTLYSKTRTLRFTNTTTDEIFDWVIPTNLWYYDSTTYDELELSYGDGTNSSVIVTRKCEIDNNGVISVKATPVIETYEYPENLVLSDGDYTVALVGYTNAYLYVQLMAKNIYTTQYYTRAETNSLINQTVNSITLEVNQTLSNYSTTSQMNSAINVKANDITSNVSQTYETKTNANSKYSEIKQTTDGITSTVATKVGNNEIISKINQSSEQVTINANKISLAGKTINMTSDNIAINSTNFNVDKNGNVTANNVTLNSGTFKGNINTSSNCTIGNNLYIGQNQSGTYFDNKYIYLDENQYIRRYLSSTIKGLEIKGKDVIHIKVGNSDIEENNSTIRLSPGGNEEISTSSGYIYLAHNPTIGSDKKLKKKIKKIKDVSWIDNLKIKEYEYKNSKGIKRIGLIAQDYENKDYAKYFLEKNENGYYGIRYNDITNALIQYSQELKQQLNRQQEEIENLKKNIKLLKESEKKCKK